MAKIICKKCGSEIEADYGVCPVCGAIYYVIPAEGAAPGTGAAPARSAQPAATRIPEEDGDVTRIWREGAAAPLGEPEEDVKVWTGSGARAAAAARPQPAPQRPVQQRPAQSPQRPVQQQRPAQGGPAQRRSAGERPPQNGSGVRRSAGSGGGRTPPPGRRPPERRGGSKLPFVVLAVALLAVLTVILCLMNGIFDFTKGKDQGPMPSLVGETKDNAVSRLDALSVSVVLQYEESDQADGIVLRQSPDAGTSLQKGDVVTLVISGSADSDGEVVSGQVEVPDVKNTSYDEAVRTLEGQGLKVSRSGDIYDDSIGEGKVASQSPEAGTKVEPGSTVVLSVSKGPTPPTTWAITVTAGKGGSISPKGRVEVEDGDTQTFTITPDEGYEIREVKVDGKDVGAVDSYTFSNVTADHSLYVVFQLQEEEEESPSPSPSPSVTPTPTPTPTPSAPPPESTGGEAPPPAVE